MGHLHSDGTENTGEMERSITCLETRWLMYYYTNAGNSIKLMIRLNS